MSYLPSVLIKLALLTMFAAAANGVLALWAATSRQLWFLRVGLLALALGIVAAVPAEEPAAFFLSQAVAVVSVSAVWRARSDDGAANAERSFSLQTLLFATTFVALLVWFLASLPEREPSVWFVVVYAGMACGAATLSAACVVRASEKRWWLFAACFPTLVLLTIPLFLLDAFLVNFEIGTRLSPPAGFIPWSYAWHWLWLLPGVFLLTAVWLGLLRGAARGSQPETKHAFWKKSLCRAGLGIVSVLVLGTCAHAYRIVSTRPQPPMPQVPAPNGYDKVIEASSYYVDNAFFGAVDNATEGELTKAVELNAAMFAKLDQALSQQCEKHFDYESDELDLNTINDLRAVARALFAKGQLFEKQNRCNDAADCYLQVVTLGNRIDRGGLLVDWLVGLAIDDIGFDGLFEITDQVSPGHRNRIVASLKEIELNREPLDEVCHRDRIWTQLAMGWAGRLSVYLQGDAAYVPIIAEQRSRAVCRLVMLQYLIANFVQLNGAPPASLDELGVDDWVRQDPFSDSSREFGYAVSEGDYVLYSVGEDGDDDGGAKNDTDGPWPWDGDLLLKYQFTDD